MKNTCALALTVVLSVGSAACSERVSDAPAKDTVSPAASSSEAPAPPGVFTLKSPYPSSTTTSFSSVNCNLEGINGASFSSTPVDVARSAPLAIVGWGYDDGTRQPAKSLTVALLDSQNRLRYFATGVEPQKRPDVGAYLRVPELVDVGFAATLSLQQVEPGPYRMLVGVERAADVSYCDVGRQVRVQ